jgi:hypothetical protein
LLSEKMEIKQVVDLEKTTTIVVALDRQILPQV